MNKWSRFFIFGGIFIIVIAGLLGVIHLSAIAETDSITSQDDNRVDDFSTNTTTELKKSYLPIMRKPAPPPTWEILGQWPEGEEAISVAICANDPTIVFAGTENGILQFADQKWLPVDDVAKAIVTGLVINNACDTIYASVFDAGVYQGDKKADNWKWLEVGTSDELNHVRSLVLEEKNLFAGGDFGIKYWDTGPVTDWIETNAPGSAGQPIMELAVSDPIHNSGMVYAVQWYDENVWYLGKGDNPATGWREKSGLGAPPDPPAMRTVAGNPAGDELLVGTSEAFYQLAASGNRWYLQGEIGTQSLTIDESIIYAGHRNGAGVSVSINGKPFTPFNTGWVPIPKTINQIIAIDYQPYAAASNGVWIAR